MISFAGGIVADRIGIMRVANTAHASGLLFGLVAGAAALPRRWARTWAAAALTCLVAVASLPLAWAPWSPSWNGVQGDRAYNDNDLDAALAHFTRAVELEPEYPWAHEQIGWCHRDRNAYGLAVDALDRAPGIYSARYSGPGATDESNIQLLLEELGSVALERRTAHYVCHMTLCDPSGKILAESEAYCRGRIVFEPRGSNGFGYDPVFEVIEYHRTFGELSATVKACLSHRARAAGRLIPRLTELVSSGQLT